MESLTAKEIRRLNEGLPPWESMSFACGGWLQFYMFGVAKALQASKLDKDVRYYGCSAGALTAAGLVLEGEFDDAIQFCKDYCVPKAYSEWTGLFSLGEYVRQCLDMTLLTRYRQLPAQKLNVAVTRLPLFQGEVISEFDSHEDLVAALTSSAAAFPFAPLVYNKGGWYVDGGLTSFQPVEDDDTITVSPFYFSDGDIKPSRYVPLWWALLPPRSEKTVDWLYRLGWEDTLQYLKSRNIPFKLHKFDDYHNATVDHPYNVSGQVSMHRFLGYDLGSITHEYVSFVLDFILLSFLVLFWKPFVLILIYCELFIRISLLSMGMGLEMMKEFSPASLLERGLRAMRPLAHFTTFCIGVSLLEQKSAKACPKNTTLQDLLDCWSCVASLSLLLKFFSPKPKVGELRKHKKLARYSVVYRVFRHMI